MASPTRRRRRPLLGIALLLLTLVPLTWLGAMGFARIYFSPFVLKDTPSAAYRLEISPRSTAAAMYSNQQAIPPSPIELMFSYGDYITKGRSCWLRSPSGRHIEVTHAVAAPVLVVTAGTLVVAAAWCFGLLRRRPPNSCPSCGYSTAGLTTSTCPECGKPATAAR